MDGFCRRVRSDMLRCFPFISLWTFAGAKPHIVMHVIDDFGWNDPGFRNENEISTPTLNLFHETGITLDQYYVQPTCSPSRATFLSGRFPLHTGLNNIILWKSAYGLPLDETTLPELLGKAGYRRHAIGKWHLGYFKTEYTPTFRGFESFYGYYAGSEDYYNHSVDRTYDLHRERHERCGVQCSMVAWEDDGKYSTNLFAEEAVKVIHQHNTSEPLFLYQAWQGVHAPRQVPQHYIDPYIHRINDTERRDFAGMVSALDEGIGNVTSALEEKGMLSNTVVIVTTDNGGPIVDCSGIGASNWPLRGGKCSLWEGGTRGTALVVAPEISSSFTWGGLMHGADWLPTIVEGVAGIRIMPGDTKPLDGVNVWKELISNQPSPRKELYYGLADRLVGDHGPSLRTAEGWKVLIGTGGGSGDRPAWWRNISRHLELTADHRPRLYNVRQDPSEKYEVSDDERIRDMVTRMHHYEESAVPEQRPDLSCPEFEPRKSAEGEWLGPWCDHDLGNLLLWRRC